MATRRSKANDFRSEHQYIDIVLEEKVRFRYQVISTKKPSTIGHGFILAFLTILGLLEMVKTSSDQKYDPCKNAVTIADDLTPFGTDGRREGTDGGGRWRGTVL